MQDEEEAEAGAPSVVAGLLGPRAKYKPQRAAQPILSSAEVTQDT